MKKIKVSVAGLRLAGLMLFGLAGCGDDNSNELTINIQMTAKTTPTGNVATSIKYKPLDTNATEVLNATNNNGLDIIDSGSSTHNASLAPFSNNKYVLRCGDTRNNNYIEFTAYTTNIPNSPYRAKALEALRKALGKWVADHASGGTWSDTTVPDYVSITINLF